MEPRQPRRPSRAFHERIETLRFLERQSGARPETQGRPGRVLYGGSGQDDIDLQQIVDDFGRDRARSVMLVATDIASEGINLHFLSHKLVHFDIPWSLMVFQQRNGRIDRYGQERQPVIAYLCTDPGEPSASAATCAFWNCSLKRTRRRPRTSATPRHSWAFTTSRKRNSSPAAP